MICHHFLSHDKNTCRAQTGAQKWSPPCDSLEITFDIRVFFNSLGLFLVMQLFEICDKKHMVWCSFKGHNSTKVHHKSVQWYPLTVFFFFSMSLHFGVSVVKHMELNT